MSDRVAIREVGMRDGLQSIAEIMRTETKLGGSTPSTRPGCARSR